MGRGHWKSPPTAHGEFPPVLYRSFDREEYARQFVDGAFRFGNLQLYTCVDDDVRRDESECDGYVQLKTDNLITLHMNPTTGEVVRETVAPGVMNLSSSHTNPKFILSCSAPPEGEEATVLRKFGRWAVRIYEPALFAQELTDWLADRNELDFPVECIRVRYRKGDLLEGEPPDAERTILSYGYKSLAYADEYEYRLLLMTGESDPPVPRDADYWNIDMRRQLPYVDAIDFGECKEPSGA